MLYKFISDFVYDCAVCPTRCDGVSKGVYNFTSDTAFSERYEKIIIDEINSNGLYTAAKSINNGYPDIEVSNKNGKTMLFVEIKVQQRTFMAVERILPHSQLKPSETLALNLSDLLRYFQIEKETGTSVYIIWILMNRPCIMPQGEIRAYYQAATVLRGIYELQGDKRRFRRQSGAGDIVDGIHKGVTVNYHFSLKELKDWKPGIITELLHS